MKLALNEDQRMLADSIDSFLKKELGHRVPTASSKAGDRKATWASFGEMGWLAVALPTEHGGLGGGALEQYVIAEAFGAALVLEPYLSSVVLGAGLLARAGTAAQVAEYLPRIGEGALQVAFAFAEAGSRFDLSDVALRAEKRDGSYVLSGRKIAVWDAPDADLLIVLARTAGARRERAGLGLFVVAADAPGLTSEAFPMVDRRRGAHLAFDAVPVQAVLGDVAGALPIVEDVVDHALAYLAAEACGAMRAANARTVDYLKQRKQFGKPLADFQVLRHRVVDMTVQLECTRSLALHAAVCAQDGSPALRRAAAAAKAQAGRAGRLVGYEAVQLHGGVGMTDELAIGQYLKRLLMIDMAFGNAAHQHERFAGLADSQPD